jgi:hypothetical protein
MRPGLKHVKRNGLDFFQSRILELKNVSQRQEVFSLVVVPSTKTKDN